MSENNELKICYEKLREVMDSIKQNRDAIDKIRNELDDNVRVLIDILPTLLAQSENRILTDNSGIVALQNDIQLLTKKIDSLQSNRFESTVSIPHRNDNYPNNSIERRQTVQHNNVTPASNKIQYVDEEKALEQKIASTSASIAQIQAQISEKQKAISNQILVEKYKIEMEKYVNDYNKQMFAASSDIKLNVLPEEKKRLSKNNFDSWNEIKDVENICLIETSSTFSYQAKPLNLDDGNENQYYLVAPNRLTSNFTRKTVVEDAYLAFFCFTNNGISERGNRGKLIKPATFQKVDGLYKLISKGEIELL